MSDETAVGQLFKQLVGDKPSAYITQQVVDKWLTVDSTRFISKKQQKKIDKWLRKIKRYDFNYSYTKGVIGNYLSKPIKVIRYNRLSLPTEG